MPYPPLSPVRRSGLMSRWSSAPPEIERPPLPKIEMPARNPELQRLVEEALRPVVSVLKKPKVRFIMEREPAKEASAKIVERMKSAEAKMEQEWKKEKPQEAAEEEL